MRCETCSKCGAQQFHSVKYKTGLQQFSCSHVLRYILIMIYFRLPETQALDLFVCL